MTEETPTIVQRLDNFFDDFDGRYGEPVPMLATELIGDAKAEIERLQSELNTALERVKVLEEAIAYINQEAKLDQRSIGYSLLDEIEHKSRAVLQSSGGK